MEIASTIPGESNFTTVYQTSNDFGDETAGFDSRPYPSDISLKTNYANKSEGKSIMPTDLDDDASDDEVVSLGDDLEIVTVSQFVKPDTEKTVISSGKALDDRPDYSSTTSESGDEDDVPRSGDAKFFLASDVAVGTTKPISTTNLAGGPSRINQKLILDKTSYAKTTVSQEYTRCLQCLHNHQNCDRQLPKCSRCVTESDCVYLKKDVYPTVTKTVRAWEAANGVPYVPQPRSARSVSKGIAPEQKPSEGAQIDDKALKPASQASLKQIFWIDGGVSTSQRSCPKSIMKFIINHLTEFEAQVVATRWPPHKTVDSDKGRMVVYVHQESNQKIPVARYHYGKNSQFFVAWIPGKSANDAPEPAICKFQVFDGTTITLDGQSWMAITWKTWVPRNVSRKSHIIYRCMPEKPTTKPKSTNLHLPRQFTADLTDHLHGDMPYSIDDGVTPRSGSAGASRSFSVTDSSLKRKRTVSIDLHEPEQSLSKKQKDTNAHEGTSRPTTLRHRSDSRMSIDTPLNPHATRSTVRLLSGKNHTKDSTHMPLDADKDEESIITRVNQYIAREPVKKGPNLSCIFRDKEGNEKGTYPYHECDTAQKLFDVACVAQIAQIEPPATRLLKISFDGGGEGRLRPDNQNDFTNVFEAELNKLMNKGGTSAWKVTISPYL